jgi:hypothetical protein
VAFGGTLLLASLYKKENEKEKKRKCRKKKRKMRATWIITKGKAQGKWVLHDALKSLERIGEGALFAA